MNQNFLKNDSIWNNFEGTTEIKPDLVKYQKMKLFIDALKQFGRMKSKDLNEPLGYKTRRFAPHFKNAWELLGRKIASYGGHDGGFELLDDLTHDEWILLKNQLDKTDQGKQLYKVLKREISIKEWDFLNDKVSPFLITKLKNLIDRG